jgi:G3E family GTPase
MIPVVVLATVDPVLRETAVLSWLTDRPGTGVLRQDLDPEAGMLRRVVGDEHGVVEDLSRPADRGCPGCVLRENALPAVAAMVKSGRWQRIVVALPVSAASVPAARPLADPCARRRLGIELAAVVSVVDVDRAGDDLMGDERVGQRGGALAVGDRRSVGEALAAQLGHADLVLTTGSNPVGLTLVDHLRGIRSARRELHQTRVAELFAARHSARSAAARLDPRTLQPSSVPDAHGVWTLDLVSHRPMHPVRFMARLADLAGGRVRARGRFQVPTRAGRLAVLDGAGGHLSIGDAGRPATAVGTRVLLTGTGPERAQRRQVFAEMLLTDDELASGRDWSTVDDGLDDWLGPR